MTEPSESANSDKKIKVWVCTPCYGGQAWVTYIHGVVGLSLKAKELGLGMALAMPCGESHVDRARNRCVNMFMRDPEATHLLFVDSDIGFEWQDAVRLLSHDLDIVGGLYPRKGDTPSVVGRVIPGSECKDGLIEAEELGTGFICIKREVFERMRDEGYAAHYVTDYGEGQGENDEYAYYFSGVRDGIPRWVSEDYAWARLARRMGYKIFADLELKLSHSGVKVWRTDPNSIVLEPTDEPEAQAAQ